MGPCGTAAGLSCAALCRRSLAPLAKSGDALIVRFGKWLTMLDAATCAALLGDNQDEEGDAAHV